MMDLSELRIDPDCEHPNPGGSSAIERLSALVGRSASESDDFNTTKFERKAKTRRRRRGKSYRTTSEYPSSQRCRLAPRAHCKILKIFNILIISLLYHHQCLSNVYQPTGFGVLADQVGSAPGNLSKPAQFFLPTDQSIKLVGGGLQPRSEEEEGGFIMRTASSAIAQHQPSSAAQVVDSTAISEKALAAGTEAPNLDLASTVEADDQRIPINSNRQQYITHDQLSLLNASTKDEHINLTSNDQEVQPLSSSLLQKAQSPRTGGMSKVSHVSSFISGK